MHYERISLEQYDLANVLNAPGDAQIDGRAFGVITLDRNGTVLKYNATEAAITGRDPARSSAATSSRTSRRAHAPASSTAGSETAWPRANPT